MPPAQSFALVEGNLRASHILIAWKDVNESQSRSKREARNLAVALLDSLKSDAQRFASLATRYSDDRGSQSKGGYLGSFPKGRMVKAFEERLMELQEGQIATEPLQTEFGFHILKREVLAEPLFGAYLIFKADTQVVESSTVFLDSLFTNDNPPLSVIKVDEPDLPQVLPALAALPYDGYGYLRTTTGVLYMKRVELVPVYGSHILIGWKSDLMPVRRSKAEAQAFASDLLRQLQANPSLFESFATEHSDSPSKRKKGAMGLWFKGGKITRYPESTTAITLLEKGQIGLTLIEGISWFEIIRRD